MTSWPRSSSALSTSTSITNTPVADPRPGEIDRVDALLRDALHRVWGFSDFRPLQLEAMRAILAARDSVVVMPTGGGKSLCFQAPAVIDVDVARLKRSRSDGSSPAPDADGMAREGFSRASM